MDVLASTLETARLTPPRQTAFSRWRQEWWRVWRSRAQWVGFASQCFFFNPYLAAVDMFLLHPGAWHGLASRSWATFWAALGTCSIYSGGRDRIFKRLGLLAPGTIFTCAGAMLADTAYGFILNAPGFVLNYKLSGCAWMAALGLGVKACASVCWTSFIAGGSFDTFHALDSDDPTRHARVPAWVRWLVIGRLSLPTRRRLIWICLATSTAVTAAIYCFAPRGLINFN